MFDFNEWIKDPKNTMSGNFHQRFLRQVVCKDGFAISVQVSEGYYCQPREVASFYDLVECCYPTATPEFILEYADDVDNPTKTIYGYVPVKLVNKLINYHGGAA